MIHQKTTNVGKIIIRSGFPRMTHAQLTAFGLLSVTAMLLCYALEHKNSWFILAFAVSCWFGAAYGFLQGAWPFGIMEVIWGFVAMGKWRKVYLAHRRPKRG